MIKRIIARHNEKILVRVTKHKAIPGMIKKIVFYEIWHSEIMYHMGIAAEIIGDTYIVYMTEIFSDDEILIKSNFELGHF